MLPVSKSEFIALQKKLTTDKAIGKKFGVTRQAIHHWREKFGIEASTAKNAERNKKMIAMHRSGISGVAVAKKFDLSIAQTSRILNGGHKAKRNK